MLSEVTPVCQIVNALLRRLGPWHTIQFNAIGPSVIDVTIGSVRGEIRASEWFAGNRRIVMRPMRSEIQVSDQDRYFVSHLNGILNDLKRTDSGELAK